MAALLLAGREHLDRLGLPHPTVAQVIEATGVSRSQAYELRDALLVVLPSLQRPKGRPPAPPREANTDTAYVLLRAVSTFLMEHPGSVYGGPARRRYDDTFRRFVLELREHHAEVDLESFAAAILVPLGTLKEWLGTAKDAGTGEPADEDAPDQELDAASVGATSTTPAVVQIEAVLSYWKTWNGCFVDFCEHVRHELRIPFGRTLIANILLAHGVRRPRQRGGRSPDERALRGAFDTFFGGAQWVGDGSPIIVTINRERFCFNLELMVDAKSAGFVGMSIRDAEDSAAVTEAFHDGVETTGEAPLALLLDNRPSNHTPEVDVALVDGTLRIRATMGRPQNKAHCEGGFGLFQQSIPALDLLAHSGRDLARQVLELVAQTFARTLNHRPRADRAGRSRVELYRIAPTEAQIEQARAALKERWRKQELARMTLSARLNPVVRALLDEAFERLALLDPERHIRIAIARYPMDSVVDGIATFEAKRLMNTLPAGVDARYLLGIVRNIGDEREGVAIAEALLRARIDARDRLLAPLVVARDDARKSTQDLRYLVLRFVDHALAAERRLDRLFWLLAAAEVLTVDAKANVMPLVHAAVRRIHATHRVSYRERLDAVRFLVAKVASLD